MKTKTPTRARRRQGHPPAALTPAAMGLDPQHYAAALRYLFDRPVPAPGEPEWYWDLDEPAFQATPLEWTRIQTLLFARAGTDLAPYSDEQVGMGLNHVMSNNAGDIPHMAHDPFVPLDDALRMLQAMPYLWRDCIGPRLAQVSARIGSGTAGRLGFVCYMWFDVWPTFWNARHLPQWRDALWQLFCEMLDMPCREVQIAALHGIGHDGRDLQRPPGILNERVERFIRQVRDDDELITYARAAASGMVQ
jgi:hypothetical protein